MIFYIIGAVLGAVQLGLPLIRRKRVVEMPILFVAVGAALGALVYGTIMWFAASWLGVS